MRSSSSPCRPNLRPEESEHKWNRSGANFAGNARHRPGYPASRAFWGGIETESTRSSEGFVLPSCCIIQSLSLDAPLDRIPAWDYDPGAYGNLAAPPTQTAVLS
jgi:hypothetical protein